jgi:hypothetical protein
MQATRLTVVVAKLLQQRGEHRWQHARVRYKAWTECARNHANELETDSN